MTETETEAENAKKEIEDLTKAYAVGFAEGNIKKISACLTEDCVALNGRKPAVVGRKNVQDEIKKDITENKIIGLKFEVDEIFAEGIFGFARGRTRGVIEIAGERKQLRGKFLWVLRCEEGSWKIARDATFADTVAPPTRQF